MSIKILGGAAQNFSLNVPTGHTIRPMAVMLKRRVFDAYQDLDGVVFVDLCGGSGAVGIEAWSRGATEVYLSELNKKVFFNLKKNLERLNDKFSDESKRRPLKAINMNCLKWIEVFKTTYLSWKLEQKENTILFFAPPYPEHKLYERFLTYLESSDWFVGQLWVESDTQKGVSLNNIEDWGRKSNRVFEQGTTFLSIINY
jgi:16S rRNA (guanine966-N2)-methyltransferase